MVGGAAGYFVVNLLLVTRATTLYMGTPFSHGLRSDLMFGLSVSAVLLCLAPVVVTVLQFSPILYPLLLVPLVGVYFSGRQTVRTVPPSTSLATTASPSCPTGAGSSSRSDSRA